MQLTNQLIENIGFCISWVCRRHGRNIFDYRAFAHSMDQVLQNGEELEQLVKKLNGEMD